MWFHRNNDFSEQELHGLKDIADRANNIACKYTELAQKLRNQNLTTKELEQIIELEHSINLLAEETVADPLKTCLDFHSPNEPRIHPNLTNVIHLFPMIRE
jgi:hypothetical protein